MAAYTKDVEDYAVWNLFNSSFMYPSPTAFIDTILFKELTR